MLEREGQQKEKEKRTREANSHSTFAILRPPPCGQYQCVARVMLFRSCGLKPFLVVTRICGRHVAQSQCVLNMVWGLPCYKGA
uniref:Uncharacterized protein n=1 Tax=Arundo donax TaxID=35708 RepID=A0A0A9BY83_ARUDO